MIWRGETVTATVTARYTGQFRDFDFTDPFAAASRRVMPAFTLVGLNVTREISEDAEIFLRVDNLFDEDYQEQYTAVSPGRTASVGIRKGF